MPAFVQLLSHQEPYFRIALAQSQRLLPQAQGCFTVISRGRDEAQPIKGLRLVRREHRSQTQSVLRFVQTIEVVVCNSKIVEDLVRVRPQFIHTREEMCGVFIVANVRKTQAEREENARIVTSTFLDYVDDVGRIVGMTTTRVCICESQQQSHVNTRRHYAGFDSGGAFQQRN